MKKTILACCVLLLSMLNANAAMNWGRGGKCQILDKGPLPLYTLSGTYIDKADIEGGTDTGLFEIDGSWACAYFNNRLGGDIDTHFRFRSVFFLLTGGLDLPEHVAEVSYDLAYFNRMQNGMSLLVGLTPGIYSDLETLDGDGFFVPVRIAGVKTFNPAVSGILGLEYRSGFDRELFPILGITWQPDRTFRLEAGLPQSLLRWCPDDEWAVYAKFAWSNVSYNLRDRDNDNREQITLEDFRNSFGVQKMMDDRIGLFFEGGRVYHRSMVFERRNNSSVELEIDKALFLKVGIAGYF